MNNPGRHWRRNFPQSCCPWGKLVIILGRKQRDLDGTIASIKETVPSANVKPVILDMQSIALAKSAAAKVVKLTDTIEIIIINNTGIMVTLNYKTADDHESQLQINHTGHFIFTELIRPKLAKDGRIIFV